MVCIGSPSRSWQAQSPTWFEYVMCALASAIELFDARPTTRRKSPRKRTQRIFRDPTHEDALIGAHCRCVISRWRVTAGTTHT